MCFLCNVGFISKSNFGGSGPNKLTNKNNVGVLLELFPQVIVEPWGQTNCQMRFTPGIYQLIIRTRAALGFTSNLFDSREKWQLLTIGGPLKPEILVLHICLPPHVNYKELAIGNLIIVLCIYIYGICTSPFVTGWIIISYYSSDK